MTALNQTLNSTAVIFLLLSLLIVVGNCVNLYRRMIGKYASMAPLLAQAFAGIAVFFLAQAEHAWIPVWSPWLIGLADPAFWEILYVLVRRGWR
ncbi:MAG: hypothetical protein LM550_15910 [Candidatus Contendobacter sp.]|nr:hypothetical protein [Gammaproteobacteria bacterium]MCC8995137.1 hypothetical protein [Candidatus Contendobacter sp.]